MAFGGSTGTGPDFAGSASPSGLQTLRIEEWIPTHSYDDLEEAFNRTGVTYQPYTSWTELPIRPTPTLRLPPLPTVLQPADIDYEESVRRLYLINQVLEEKEQEARVLATDPHERSEQLAVSGFKDRSHIIPDAVIAADTPQADAALSSTLSLDDTEVCLPAMPPPIPISSLMVTDSYPQTNDPLESIVQRAMDEIRVQRFEQPQPPDLQMPLMTDPFEPM